ncbi:F0F1 ATP synthase subunit B [Fulvimarina endophytica]|uniref:ATP synthase subunit b n=2 Tax=Fulvimarina endophytica TaxID=2293836 RepID=A0A371X3D5_9HYPH|nr:F0F1 ATP synthase subunit B [Fulvimarina endophytica]
MAAHAQEHGASTGTDPSLFPEEGPQTQSEVGAHAEGGHNAFPPMDPTYFPSQLLWLAVTFGVFYWVLKNVLVPRVGGILENRRDRIAIDLEAAERAKQEADEAEAAYQQELTEARDRAHAIAQDARNEARREGDAQRSKLEAELDGRLDEARERIALAKSNAMNEMDGLATDVAETILRDVVKIDVSRDEVASAVAETRR